MVTETDINPLAKQLAEENNVDWRALNGTGPGGRVVEKDVLGYLARVMAGEESVNPTAEPVPAGMEAWPEEDVRAFQPQPSAPTLAKTPTPIPEARLTPPVTPTPVAVTAATPTTPIMPTVEPVRPTPPAPTPVAPVAATQPTPAATAPPSLTKQAVTEAINATLASTLPPLKDEIRTLREALAKHERDLSKLSSLKADQETLRESFSKQMADQERRHREALEAITEQLTAKPRKPWWRR